MIKINKKLYGAIILTIAQSLPIYNPGNMVFTLTKQEREQLLLDFMQCNEEIKNKSEVIDYMINKNKDIKAIDNKEAINKIRGNK